ncbi:hypothetical protein H2266_00600 [Campylobacter sp. RM10543]|nr:hypothetical protein [Campylobacter sp. RM10543]
MKNLSIQEKRDLDTCVFQNLGQNDFSDKINFFKKVFLKIKLFFYSK